MSDTLTPYHIQLSGRPGVRTEQPNIWCAVGHLSGLLPRGIWLVTRRKDGRVEGCLTELKKKRTHRFTIEPLQP